MSNLRSENRSIRAILLLLLLSFMAGTVYSSSNEISGRVTNGTINIPSARVRVQATKIFTTTHAQGKFTLKGISSSDTLVLTAWAEGYYNGSTHAVAGDTNVVITLHPLPSQDNPSYEWLSPDPDSSEALRCGNCHAKVLMDQWRSDAHGNSATNPFFLSMYYGTDIDGNSKVGIGYKRDFEHTRGNCATCHIPGAAANNPWDVDPKEVTGVNRQGIFCDFCHKMYRVKPSTGQGTTGVLSIELLRPPEGQQMFFGPYDDIHEPDAYLPLIRRSDFCAPCHTGKFWGIPAYNCFPEWQASPYPAMGVECQTCHMAPDSVTTNFAPGKGGSERDPLTIPTHIMPGSRDPKILANSVTMKVSAAQSHDFIKVMVTIYNDKTGHHVPTGHPSRNMILLVDAQTRSSAPLEYLGSEKVPYWGGVGDPATGNFAGLPGKGFAKILEDFQEISPAPQWRQTRVLSDNRMAAVATDTSFSYFREPAAPGEITISAKLLFRRFFKPWMDEKKFAIPDIVMQNESIKIQTNPVSVEEHDKMIPRSFWLGQNFPNPFNAMTTISLSLKQPQQVALNLYNVSGQRVKTVLNHFMSAGQHTVKLNLSDLPNGLYVYRLEVGGSSIQKKFLLIR